MSLSSDLRELSQRVPEAGRTLAELAARARELEEHLAAAEFEVPRALRERAPVLGLRGWVQAMRRRVEQLEAPGFQLDLQRDVEAFHHKFGHPAPGAPRLMTPELARFRASLVQEEAAELAGALDEHANWSDSFEAYKGGGRGSLARVAGEACDLLYVTLGTLVAAGLWLEPFWREVHRANMEKEPNPAGGKPVKPAGWRPPDLEGALGRQS